MSKNGKTEIILVIDRSGSMTSIKSDMEGGLNTFLEEQKKLDGEAYLTYFSFDDKTEKVFELQSLDKVEPIQILPRGSTALTDAIGSSINDVRQRNDRTPEGERAETVIFVVITDGFENSSYEYTASQVKEMVKDQESNQNWKFIFMGANIDSVTTSNNYGFTRGSTIDFAANEVGATKGSETLCAATSFYRASSTKSDSYEFSDGERSAAMGEKS